MAGVAELEHVIAPICSSHGVELVDVELRPGTLLVTVEHVDPEVGLDLDKVAEVARAVSSALDANDDLAPSDRYELEVTSPGVERRLRRRSHFEKALGQRVSVRTIAGTAGSRRIEGELTHVDDEGIVVDVDPPGAARHIAFGEIDRAHTIFDWRDALRASKEQLAKERATIS